MERMKKTLEALIPHTVASRKLLERRYASLHAKYDALHAQQIKIHEILIARHGASIVREIFWFLQGKSSAYLTEEEKHLYKELTKLHKILTWMEQKLGLPIST